MPRVTFITCDGDPIVVEAKSGLSLLEIARHNNIDLEGACDGSLACSTCHVIVKSCWYRVLVNSTEEEEDLLDLAFNLTPTSRLGCQITITDELDGLIVTIPSATRNIMNLYPKDSRKDR